LKCNLTTRLYTYKSGVSIAQYSQAYDALNRVTTGDAQYGSNSPYQIAIQATYTYDDINRVTALSYSPLASVGNWTFTYNYTFDGAGNLSGENQVGTTGSFTYNTTYAYDADNQLTAGTGMTTISYDANGNRNNGFYSTTTANEITSDGTWNYSYDAEGNVTTKTITSTGEKWTYTYDEKNELLTATHKPTTSGSVDLTATYTYDAFGNRIESDVWQASTGVVTTKFAMDGWNPALAGSTGNSNWNVLADLTSTGAVETRYLRGDVVDQLFARFSYSGGTFTPNWYLTDMRGSVRYVINDSATVLDAIRYDGFGNITTETNSTYRGRYAWTGRELDVETGLQYNRGRYYNAKIGKWMSQDPLGFDAGDSNLYRYVRNEPDRATDPSGYGPFDEWPNYLSVKQGGADCAFAAVGASFAQQRPQSIVCMINTVPKSLTYDVYLPGLKKPYNVDIAKEEARLTGNERYSTSNAKWLEILEIAAGRRLTSLLGEPNIIPYAAVQGPALASPWIDILTGHTATSYNVGIRSDGAVFDIIKEAWDEKKIVVALTLFSNRSNTGIEAFHWYAVTGYGTSRICGKYVKLFNPWGENKAEFGPRKSIRGFGEPEFTMYMSEFRKSFTAITCED